MNEVTAFFSVVLTTRLNLVIMLQTVEIFFHRLDYIISIRVQMFVCVFFALYNKYSDQISGVPNPSPSTSLPATLERENKQIYWILFVLSLCFPLVW